MPHDSLTNAKGIFRTCVIAAVQPLSPGLTTSHLRNWIEMRQGTFKDNFDAQVTHLLCTPEHFKQRLPPVPEALKNKKVHIVRFEWFELSTGGREKRLPEAKYCLRMPLEVKLARRRREKQIKKGKQLQERFVNTNLFRVHFDRLYFPYQVEITRDNFQDSGQVEKYILYLFESIAEPKLYFFAVKYFKCKGDPRPKHYRKSDFPRRLGAELSLFRDFFEQKTGIEWEDRIIQYKRMPADKFQYTPPMEGKPVGRRTLFGAEYCWQLNAALRMISVPGASEDAAGDGLFGDGNGAKASAVGSEENTRDEIDAAVGHVEMEEAD